MSTTLSVNNFKASIGWDYQATNSFGTNTTNSFAFSANSAFTNGSGNGKASKIYAATLTVTGGGGTSSIDLISATTDPLGQALSFAKVKGIYVCHKTPAATGTTAITGNFLADVVMGDASASYTLNPGHFFLLGGGATNNDLGWAATAGTADTITFTNADAASVSIDVCIIGE